MNTPALIPKILDDLLKFTASCWQSTNALSTSDQASLAVACQGCILLHSSVPANSVAKPPCADTPIRRRMARRGHIRRYADTTVGGLGWLTPIRAYAGTPLADMPVRGKIRRYADTPGKYADTPIQEQIRRYADTRIQEANTPIRRSGQGGWHGVSVYRCGAEPPPSPLPSPLPPPPPPPLPAPAGPHQASRPHLPCPGWQRAGKQSPVKLNNLSGFPGLGLIGFTRV